MTIEYLDKSGLTLLISKIKTALGGKSVTSVSTNELDEIWNSL